MHDLIIVGAGPGGLTAALYAERYGLNTLVLSETIGGTANYAPLIENWPGINSISGFDLMKKFAEQVKSPIKTEKVISVSKDKNNKNFAVKTEKETYESKCVIIATGTKRIKLIAENSDKFEGKGISYCVTCDAPLFKNKTVAVLGGGNSALEAAIMLSKYAKKIYLIFRKDKLTANVDLTEQAKKKGIEMIPNSNVTSVKGGKFLSSIVLNNEKEINIEGLFVEFGGVPAVDVISSMKVSLDKDNSIVVNSKKETNIKGLFAIGDVTDTPLKQIVTACSDGAIAALSAYGYVKNYNQNIFK